jgi:hypothetical protein
MDPIAINGALGAVLPLALAILEQGSWPKQLRAAFAMLVALAAGVVAVHAEGKLVMPQGPAAAVTLAGDIIAVLVASQAAYQGLNKTGLLDGIESATNIPPIPRIHIQVGEPQPTVVAPVVDEPVMAPAEAPADAPAAPDAEPTSDAPTPAAEAASAAPADAVPAAETPAA